MVDTIRFFGIFTDSRVNDKILKNDDVIYEATATETIIPGITISGYNDENVYFFSRDINQEQVCAAYEEVLSVGAIDRNSVLTENTNYGDNVKIFAPGEDILSIVADNDPDIETHVNGTSFATPFVTCLAALIKSRNPSATPKQIIGRIIDNSDLIYYNDLSYHVINFKKCLSQY